MPHVVDHLAARHELVNPVGLQLGHRAQHDAEPGLIRQLNEFVIVVKTEPIR